jgi:hypothetical protein
MDEFRVDWVELPYLGLTDTLALSALPGCRYTPTIYANTKLNFVKFCEY